MSFRRVRLALSVLPMILVTVIAVRAGQVAQIPPGPSVRVSDGWYHLEDCSIAVGRQAPSMPLADALRRSQRPCPICEPLAHQPEWAAFVASHGETIRAEVKAKAEADAAEAKRKLEAEEADRARRLKELEDERKRKETAPVVRLTEAQARDIAASAAAEAAGDAGQFQSIFRSKVRTIAPEYSGPQIVYASAVLKIIAAGPLARFEAAALDRVQRRLPIGGAVWSPDVAIVVAPESAEAPDIKQIVVQRSDSQRPAGAETQATVLSSTLAPRRLPGSAPTAKSVMSGEVIFPLATFEPGEGVSVRVIAVPAAGANLSRTFSLMALRAIQ
jgi:hypothetical protein